MWVRIPPSPLYALIFMSRKLFYKISKLKPKYKKIFLRIFEFKIEKTKLLLPQEIKKSFSQFEKQEIFILRNKILKQETHFNIQRGKRKEPLKENNLNNFYDPFCDPLKNTPFDSWGRLENKFAITASNLAKSSKNHSLVIFKEHNLEKVNLKDIENVFKLANLWLNKFNDKFKIIIWNFGFRAGASIYHPHLQIFSLNEMPLKIKDLFDKFDNYKNIFNSDYLKDYFLLTKFLKLGEEYKNIKISLNLTPIRDKEIIFWGDNFDKKIKNISYIVYSYLKSLFQEDFNLFLFINNNSFLGFLVSRGNKNKLNSDIGSLELYAFSVVGFDLIDFSRIFFTRLKELKH